MSFTQLPQDIEYNILEYTGDVKYRNGKYMFQIPKNDLRYKILERIPKPRPFYLLGDNGTEINLTPNYINIKERKSIVIKYNIPTTWLSYSYTNLLYNEENKDLNSIRYLEYI